MSNPGGYANHSYYSQQHQYSNYQGYPGNYYLPQSSNNGQPWPSWDPYTSYPNSYYPTGPQYPPGFTPQTGQYGESSDTNGEPAPPGTEPSVDSTVSEQQKTGDASSNATASSQASKEVGAVDKETQPTSQNSEKPINPPPPSNQPAAAPPSNPPPASSTSTLPTPLMSTSPGRPYENAIPQNPNFQGQMPVYPNSAPAHLGQQPHYFNQQPGYPDWQANGPPPNRPPDMPNQWSGNRDERSSFRGKRSEFGNRRNIRRTVYRNSLLNRHASRSPPRGDNHHPMPGVAAGNSPPLLQQPPPQETPLDQPSAPEPLQASQPPPSKENEADPKPPVPLHACDLPDPMKEYVTKCFTMCQNNVERDAVEKYLKEDLNKVVEKGDQWSLNFATMPLPPILRKYQQPKRKPSRWDPPTTTTTATPTTTDSSATRPQSSVASFSLTTRPTFASNTSVHPEFGPPASYSRNPNKRGFQSPSKSFEDHKPFPKKKKLKGKMKQFQTGANERDQLKLNSRSQRFQLGGDGTGDYVKKVSLNDMLRTAHNTVVKGGGEDGDWCEYRVQGTSTSLLKQYLRLTSAPDPSTVRPEHVLRRSLQHIRDTWRGKNSYRWTCEQLKSVRQDLTVQGVRNSFTVEVYEMHARVALEMGDHEEFNQCQNQLKELYVDHPSDHQDEFLAYRILYCLFTKDTSDLANNIASVSSSSKDHPAVAHALKLRKAWTLSNYHAFFKLYQSTPNLGVFLLNKFVARERLAAFKTMTKAFRPSLPIFYVCKELAFPSEEECRAFIVEHNGVLMSSGDALDSKATFAALTAPQT